MACYMLHRAKKHVLLNLFLEEKYCNCQVTFTLDIYICHDLLSRYTDEFVRNAFVLVTIKLKNSI